MFKFRFVTSSLLARYKGVSRISINKTLNILLDQQYIGKHYDKSYKIQGKGASYYLAPKALTLLRDTHKLNEQVLHAMYKNKSVSQGFIDHNLTIFAAYLALCDSYPGVFHIFTRTELADFDYFPEPHPSLYLNRIKPKDDGDNEYILDIMTDSQLFVAKKRFKDLLEHYDSGDWEAETENSYPVILLVCADSRMELKLQEFIVKTLDDDGIDELKVYTTTINALVGSDSRTKAILCDVKAPNTICAL